MRILYIHPSGAYGGSSKSLIELFRCLRIKGVEATVLAPPGTASVAFADAGMDVRLVKGLSQFDNTRYGYYRGLRWLVLLRELFFLPFSLVAVWRLRRPQFDLMHVNEVTLLPLAILIKRWLDLPMVVHVRSLQRHAKSSRRVRWVNRCLECHADAVVPIDQTVARTLRNSLALSIVHNGINLRSEQAAPSSLKRGAGQRVRVGFFGVLTALKGIYELLDAMRILKGRGVDIELVVAGENSRNLTGVKARVLQLLGFYRDVRSDLESAVKRYGLGDRVKFVGFRKDVRFLYPCIDVLCFPSHLDAPGRPVFEAALFGVPSVVAVADPQPDAVVHHVTGLAISRPDPVLIADALQLLAENKKLRCQLGRNARRWAREMFKIERSAASMMQIYRRLSSAKANRPLPSHQATKSSISADARVNRRSQPGTSIKN